MMRRIVLISLFTLVVSISFGAIKRTPLEDLSAAIEELGRYEVKFLFEFENSYLRRGGEYRVDGERYRLIMDMEEQEILGEGSERCTINHKEKEVVLERFDTSGDSAPLVVLNPVKAFTSLDLYFDAKVLSEDKKSLVLELTPKKDNGILESSIIEMDKKTSLPLSITYHSEGEKIKIVIADISKTTEDVDISYPLDYDIIDIR